MKLVQGGSYCLAFKAKINGEIFLEIILFINISYHECIKKLNCHQPAISLRQAANMTWSLFLFSFSTLSHRNFKAMSRYP